MTHFHSEVEAEATRSGYHVCQLVWLDPNLTGRAMTLWPAAGSNSREREEVWVCFGFEQYMDFNKH